MKTLAAVATAALALFARPEPDFVCADRYELKLTLHVPVILDNMDSLGRRDYQVQRLRGTLTAYYYDETKDPYVTVVGLCNESYKVQGKPVTYDTTVSDVLWRAVGDNRKGVFKQAAFGFSIEANPSYNIGDDGPDNILVLTLAGAGSVKRVAGYAGGRIGCGCREYGHVSPTRIVYIPYLGCHYLSIWPRYWYSTVDDVAPCWGTWSIRFVDRMLLGDAPQCVRVDTVD